LDPFAGGGAIPLEAMRLGCEVVGNDLNPVAWFIRAPAMMTQPLWWQLSAGRRFAQGLADPQFKKRIRLLLNLLKANGWRAGVRDAMKYRLLRSSV
jgi:adenine-specific DNA methylase